MSENSGTTDLLDITCKGCGAKLSYTPGTNHMKCQYCGAENEIAQSDATVEELDFEKYLQEFSDKGPKMEVVTIQCNACGAETSFDENIVSETCPFCDTAIIAKEGTKTEKIKPESLLPFKIDVKAGHEKFQKWIKKLWFKPKKLKEYAKKFEKLQGIYIPYWTYDSNTTTSYTGERGDDYEETETYTEYEDGKPVTKTRTVTKTRWTHASGTVYNAFDDVLVLASNSLPRKKTMKLEPWDLENLVPYDSKFISGFRTESYHLDLKEGFEDGKKIMDKTITGSVKSDIGGDHQRIYSMNVNYDDITFKHLLLPVYISAYRFKEKVYRFLINGRTGEVQGERPFSVGKIILFILLCLAIISGIVVLVMYFGETGPFESVPTDVPTESAPPV